MNHLRQSKILVVEDEFYLADDLARALERRGAVVVGPVPSLAQVTEALSRGLHLDAAVLDLRLGDDEVSEVADQLSSRGISFVFATGYSEAALPPRHRHAPRFEKPYDVERLLDHLARMVSQRSAGIPASGATRS